MPANHCVRIDNDENSLPSRPESEEGDPEDAIEWRDLGSCFLLAVCGELLSEGQLDNHLLILASEQSQSTTNNECQEVEKGLHATAILLDRAMTFESENDLAAKVSFAVGPKGRVIKSSKIRRYCF